jgi:hypothetical protein
MGSHAVLLAGYIPPTQGAGKFHPKSLGHVTGSFVGWESLALLHGCFDRTRLSRLTKQHPGIYITALALIGSYSSHADDTIAYMYCREDGKSVLYMTLYSYLSFHFSIESSMFSILLVAFVI